MIKGRSRLLWPHRQRLELQLTISLKCSILYYPKHPSVLYNYYEIAPQKIYCFRSLYAVSKHFGVETSFFPFVFFNLCSQTV